MRRFAICCVWNWLVFAAAIHAGLQRTYDLLAGEWLVDDGCDDVRRVEDEPTRAR